MIRCSRPGPPTSPSLGMGARKAKNFSVVLLLLAAACGTRTDVAAVVDTALAGCGAGDDCAVVATAGPGSSMPPPMQPVADAGAAVPPGQPMVPAPSPPAPGADASVPSAAADAGWSADADWLPAFDPRCPAQLPDSNLACPDLEGITCPYREGACGCLDGGFRCVRFPEDFFGGPGFGGGSMGGMEMGGSGFAPPIVCPSPVPETGRECDLPDGSLCLYPSVGCWCWGGAWECG